MKYCLRWNAGASAELQIFAPAVNEDDGVYQIKYTPPFRVTIRPPLQRSNLASGEFDNLDTLLGEMVQSIDARAGAGLVPVGGDFSNSSKKMREFGNILYDLTIPRFVGSDLEGGGLFLEIGMDESLLGYPWELMHDGDDFLCLKHKIGRFVNASGALEQGNRQARWEELEKEEFSVLVIAVPKPLPRKEPKVEYDELTSAEAEADGIVSALAAIGVKTELLKGEKANYLGVHTAIRSGNHHIVHFCGHAQANEKSPSRSTLVLHDKDMATGGITAYVSKAQPIFCFINACESGKMAAARGRMNVYGLARAFLETGSYLLGSRWKVSDKAASGFAAAFYTALLKEGKPLGEAVLNGRLACRKLEPNDFAWASYVLYGDPRVSFVPQGEDA